MYRNSTKQGYLNTIRIPVYIPQWCNAIIDISVQEGEMQGMQLYLCIAL